jgi:hypothetical protein
MSRKFPNVAKTPLVGGQWRKGSGGRYELVIVSNKQYRWCSGSCGVVNLAHGDLVPGKGSGAGG